MRPDSALDTDMNGYLARWTAWRSRGRSRPLAALAEGQGRTSLFTKGEIVLGDGESALLDRLLAEGAKVLPEIPLPPQPDEIGRTRRTNSARAPLTHRVRFDGPLASRLRKDGLDAIGEAARRSSRGLALSSLDDAALAGLALRLAGEGHDVTLDFIGDTATLPLRLRTATEDHPAGNDPFGWQAFAGRARIVHAWQLLESYRALGSVESIVWVAILDGGFWLHPNGAPVIPPGKVASDFGAGVPQINLIDGSFRAWGPNPNLCTNDTRCDWHGNDAASVAAAAADNGLGAAGTGAPVARPVMIRSELGVSEVQRGVRICVAWGLDVLNMSFGIRWPGLFAHFGKGSWDKTFQFAADQGLIMVAAAGNDREELPGLVIRPATRTPGVITVGALNSSDQAADYSNYGSSVAIWAPGESIPTAPNPDALGGAFMNGTSAAAPVVAGVAAMMRAIDPSLNSIRTRDILVRSGWQGAGRVTRGLDAEAALLDVMGGALRADGSERNDTSATASPLVPAGPGVLRPVGWIAAKSNLQDRDYYRFELAGPSHVTIRLEWYRTIAGLGLAVETDDAENTSLAKLLETSGPGVRRLAGDLAPGIYRIRVGGSGRSAYELEVKYAPIAIGPDQFERNSTPETATRFVFEPTPFTVFYNTWAPGVYDATLHRSIFAAGIGGERAIDPDFYSFRTPANDGRRVAVLTIADSDFPLDVALLDAAGSVMQEWKGVRSAVVKPAPDAEGMLRVSGSRPTRYRIGISYAADPRITPDDFPEMEVIPEWWKTGPSFPVPQEIIHFALDLTSDAARQDGLAFAASGAALDLELLDGSGRPVPGLAGHVSTAGKLQFDTANLASGTYILRARKQGPQPVAALRLVAPKPVGG